MTFPAVKPDLIKLLNSSDSVINPATEEKQDDIITGVERLANQIPSIEFITNEIYGADMNINVGFSGTPDCINNGGDSSCWTPSAISGTWDFTSTTHAHEGIITVIDYTGLSGDTITIEGTNITNTTLTEGIDFNAVTDNDTTASNIATAVEAIDGILSATATNNVVRVIAGIDADITAFSTTGGADMTATAQSIDAEATLKDSQMLLTRDSALDFSSYSTIALAVYLTAPMSTTRDVQLQFRLNGTNVGNNIIFSDYIDVNSLNIWQTISISKVDFGIDDDSVDELLITNAGTTLAPDYFLDLICVHESGAPVSFSYTPPAGFAAYLREITVTVVAAGSGITTVVGATENATLENFDYDKFITISKLVNGILARITSGGVTIDVVNARRNIDFVSLAATNFKLFSDGTNLMFQLRTTTPPGTAIYLGQGDSYEILVQDDLSSLLFMRGSLDVGLEAL